LPPHNLILGVISSICQQHGSRMQSGQERQTEPIVMYLTGREAKGHRQAIGVDNGVYLTGKSTSSIICTAAS
jgi:hypothetical protein